MKTKLPKNITGIDQAKVLLLELFINGESFNPKGDANFIENSPFNKREADKLNRLMKEIYDLPGNAGRRPGSMAFDPVSYIKQFMQINKGSLVEVLQGKNKGETAKVLKIDHQWCKLLLTYSKENCPVVEWVALQDVAILWPTLTNIK